MPSTSTYKNYTVPTNLGDAGAWGGYLNTTIGLVDANLGGVLTLYSSNGDVTLTSTQAANLAYVLSGTLAANYTVTFTSSLGGNGVYVVDNQCTGAFTTQVTQTSTATVALTIPQGGRSIIYGNGTKFQLADDNQTAKFYSYLGTPQGNVAGTAATANGGATNTVRDVTNQIDYACKITGSSSTALWVPQAGLPQVGGYLTVSTDANNPIIAADVSGVSSVFWTPLTSNWMWASDGTAVFPVQFSRMTLTLTNTNNAASQIQDVFYYFNAGTAVIGTGPTWAAGVGGSVTAGACARGTGAGGTALSRIQGVWTNAVQVTINNGASSYVVPAGQGVYLGSIYVDSTAGQLTCNRAWGSARKQGVWSAFNTTPIALLGGDSTASWTYAVATFRQSNASANNYIDVFSGLASEVADIVFEQYLTIDLNASATILETNIGIGVNSTTVASGTIGRIGVRGGAAASGAANTPAAEYVLQPSLGLNRINMLEKGNASIATPTFYGTQNNMQMVARWRA